MLPLLVSYASGNTNTGVGALGMVTDFCIQDGTPLIFQMENGSLKQFYVWTVLAEQRAPGNRQGKD